MPRFLALPLAVFLGVAMLNHAALAACAAGNECMSKLNGYTVLQTNGEGLSKLNGYVVLNGANVFTSKLNGYAVLCSSGTFSCPTVSTGGAGSLMLLDVGQ